MNDSIERSEAIERRAWTALYRSAPAALGRALGLRAEERDGVTLLSASGADHLLLNRAIGLNARVGSEERAAAGVVRYYEQRGIDRYWIHLGSAYRDSGIPRELRSRGLALYPRSWMKFGRRLGPVERVETTVRIRAGRETDASRVAEIVAPAFDLPEDAGAVFASAIGRAGWHYFVAEDAGRVVAASALYTWANDALLAFAATAPEARRKGAQRALMAARLHRALEVGCDWVYTETGTPVEGQPSSSYRNMLRAGFDELYVRDNFAPEGTRWQNHRSSDANARSAVSPKPSRMLRRVTARFGT